MGEREGRRMSVRWTEKVGECEIGKREGGGREGGGRRGKPREGMEENIGETTHDENDANQLR